MTYREDLPRVEIEWLDSVSLDGWHSPESTERELTGDAALKHVTVALLIHDLDDRIVVALSAGVDEDGSQLDAPMAIPRVSILSIRELERGARRRRK